ncbi:MAG: S8 family serine peptidase [Thermoplasmata archaeon]
MEKKVVIGLLSLSVAILLILGAVTGLFFGYPQVAENGLEDSEYKLIEKPEVMSPEEIGLEVVEDYGSFLLVESDSEGNQLATSNEITVLDEELDKIQLRSKTIETTPEKSVQNTDELDDGHYLVQTVGPITPEWRENLKDSGEILEYIPKNTFLMKLEASEASSVRDMDFVQWIGDYHSSYKMTPELEEKEGKVTLDISAFDLTTEVIEELDQYGEITGFSGDRLEIETKSSYIEDIAEIEEVSWMEEKVEIELMNADAQWITQTGTSDNRSIWDHELQGDGQIVGVSDTGLDYDHAAFRDPDGNSIGSDHRKVVNYVEYANDNDNAESGHGTHVCGSVAGNDDPNGDPSTNDGMAKQAKLSFFDIGDSSDNLDIPSDYSEIFSPAYDDGARVHSNSWGGSDSSYTSDAEEVDEFMWNNKDMLILYANGNSGDSSNTIGTPATAKNIVSVGASSGEGSSTEDMADFSSRGPTDDGRLKPTIVAPGTEIMSADSDGDLSTDNDGYTSMQGTSMATPITSGSVAMVREYFVDGHYPEGTISDPSAALLKSVLVNGAEEISGSGAYEDSNSYPNNDQGWGKIDLENSLEFDGDNKNLKVYDETSGISTGTTENYTVNVEDTSEPLQVTMAYTDYPGSTTADKALVNDLNLKVTAPDGSVYKGNVFDGYDPGQSTTDGEYDDLNPLENVLRLEPQSGEYKIEVIGENIPNGPQPFALAVTGGLGAGDGSPNANFDYSPTNPEPDETVEFTDQSSDSDGSIEEWSWDFGDGSTSTSQNPSHSYDTADTYTVELTVTDDDGATDTTTQDITVEEDSDGEYSTVSGGDTSYGEYITNVQLNGINKDSGDDDGYADHTESVTDDLEPGQSYELSVTMSTGGYSDYVSVVIDWDQDYDLSDDTVVEVGSGSNDPQTVSKTITVPSDAADGETRMRVMQEYDSYHTDPTADQSYGETEDYTVSVGSGSDNEAPTASFSYSPTSPTTEDTIDFTDESTDSDGSIEEWSWDFGDGSTSTSQNPSHSYDTADTYTVELTVTDDDGATDTTTQDITVEEDSGGEYCTVEGGDTSYGEYITNVQFNGINRDSDDDGGYADHTGSMSDPVEPGQSYELSVTLSTGGYSDYVSVVIDWDQDYDLSDDTVVEVGSGSNDPQTVSKTITVPSDAAEGQTRMRVMQEYDGYHTDPCSNQNYGETEDYTIDIGTTSSLSEVEMNSMSHHTELDLEQEDIQSLDIQSPIDHDVVSPTKIKDL